MTSRPSTDSEYPMGTRPVTLDEMIDDLLPGLRRKLGGEGTDAPSTALVSELLSRLLAYAWGVEMVLCAALNREGGTIPGHAVSVRGYVDQVVSGDASEIALERLAGYFKDAIGLLASHCQRTQDELDTFSNRLVEEFKPSRIEQHANVGALFRLLGLSEITFWREYVRQYRTLDPEALRKLAEGSGQVSGNH